MRDDNDSTPGGFHRGERVAKRFFALFVEIGVWLVQNKQARIAVKGARETNSLTHTAGQRNAAFADRRVITIRQPEDYLMRACRHGGGATGRPPAPPGQAKRPSSRQARFRARSQAKRRRTREKPGQLFSLKGVSRLPPTPRNSASTPATGSHVQSAGSVRAPTPTTLPAGHSMQPPATVRMPCAAAPPPTAIRPATPSHLTPKSNPAAAYPTYPSAAAQSPRLPPVAQTYRASPQVYRPASPPVAAYRPPTPPPAVYPAPSPASAYRPPSPPAAAFRPALPPTGAPPAYRPPAAVHVAPPPRQPSRPAALLPNSSR